MEFEWDTGKATLNRRKHRVRLEEASSVFGDPLAITFRDPDDSVGKAGFLTFGVSRTGVLLVVSHTGRSRRTRLISARRATRAERRIYEEG
jgi:uncharacterized DUF497 family protein